MDIICLSTMHTTQTFRKCHLQILRSLYASHENGNEGTTDDDDNNTKTNDNNVVMNTNHDGTTTSSDENDEADDDGKEGDISKIKQISAVTAVTAEEEEIPVGSDTWILIEQFLQRRVLYHPYKERQTHWSNINDEAKSRIAHLSSISSSIVEEVENKPIPSSLLGGRTSLTPRTPTLFSLGGRSNSIGGTTSMSLTPQSSNKHAPAKLSSQNDIELANTIPSMNFIQHMLQRRTEICRHDAKSFRSQQFLTKLHDEAEMRCEILVGMLNNLKLEGGGTGKKESSSIEKRKGSATKNPIGKRQKVEGDVLRSSSLLGQFLSNDKRYSEVKDTIVVDDNDDEQSCKKDNEDSIMEAKTKLYLWASLLKSVKEITDEKS